MNLITNKRAQAVVNQLVPGQWAFAVEFVGDNQRLKMGVVLAHHLDGRVGESAFYKFCDCCWVHIAVL